MAARVASTFSLLVVLCSVTFGAPTGTADPGAAARASRLEKLVKSLPIDQGAGAAAKHIKSSPLYRDEKMMQSNWWERAAESFANWIKKLLEGLKPPASAKSTPPAVLGAWAIYVMWFVLGVAALVFIVLAVTHVRWKFTLKRKSRALLEEDEPERTLDEWLERADALEAEGRYREAIRCLYLACLLRFDEARVARFDRGQTNWEHLHRIHASPGLPTGLDFEPATQAFDRIWYGMKTRGQEDVTMFRAWYRTIAGALMEKAA